MKKIISLLTYSLPTFLISILLLFFLEAITSIYFYQLDRRDNNFSSAAYSLGLIIDRVVSIDSRNDLLVKGDNKIPEKILIEDIPKKKPYSEKLIKLLDSRLNDGNELYPSYIFDPQLHSYSSTYYLANPINTNVIYCNENGFWAGWMTDEQGFRNPTKQYHSEVDYIFLGDSFIEGACENESNTIAGVFRNNRKKVLNLARGGSGPLFQLATLKEYGNLVKTSEVLWFVFLGNDIENLREERTKILSNYLTNDAFTQNLALNSYTNSINLKEFLNKQIDLEKLRADNGLPSPYNHRYGETLDRIEAEYKEADLLKKVADEILSISKKLGATLRIITIDHPKYDDHLKKITYESIRDFSDKKNVQLLEFSVENLPDHFYTEVGPHFNEVGYRYVAIRTLNWLLSLY